MQGKQMSFKFNKKYRWLWLGLVAILLRILFGIFPELCELVYSRGFFLIIRVFVDNTWGAFMPFAMLYLLFFGLMAWFSRIIYLEIKNRKNVNKIQWRKNALVNFGNFLGGFVFFFLFLWGFNYARVPLEKTMGLDVRELSKEELRKEADEIIQICINARNEIKGSDTFSLKQNFFPEDLETEMRFCLMKVLDSLGYPTISKVRGRQLYPAGLLYGFNSSGVYMPFTGEGHVESALHILQKPFTLAHEMSHGYGFGDEGTCNFLGFLACMESENPAIRYSGHLTSLRYVFNQLDSAYLYEKKNAISTGMKNDVAAIFAEMDKYFEFIPGMHAVTYEAYLRMQGIKDGIDNYDRMVLMLAAYRRKNTK
jgi:hypothetical protein